MIGRLEKSGVAVNLERFTKERKSGLNWILRKIKEKRVPKIRILVWSMSAPDTDMAERPLVSR